MRGSSGRIALTTLGLLLAVACSSTAARPSAAPTPVRSPVQTPATSSNRMLVGPAGTLDPSGFPVPVATGLRYLSSRTLTPVFGPIRLPSSLAGRTLAPVVGVSSDAWNVALVTSRTGRLRIDGYGFGGEEAAPTNALLSFGAFTAADATIASTYLEPADPDATSSPQVRLGGGVVGYDDAQDPDISWIQRGWVFTVAQGTPRAEVATARRLVQDVAAATLPSPAGQVVAFLGGSAATNASATWRLTGTVIFTASTTDPGTLLQFLTHTHGWAAVPRGAVRYVRLARATASYTARMDYPQLVSGIPAAPRRLIDASLANSAKNVFALFTQEYATPATPSCGGPDPTLSVGAQTTLLTPSVVSFVETGTEGGYCSDAPPVEFTATFDTATGEALNLSALFRPFTAWHRELMRLARKALDAQESGQGAATLAIPGAGSFANWYLTPAGLGLDWPYPQGNGGGVIIPSSALVNILAPGGPLVPASTGT